jgi:glycerol uptake facilitator-like aquaporin
MIPSERREGLSATTLAPGVEPHQGFLIEAWLTSLLVLTIFGSTNERRKGNLFMPTIPIGLAVALGIMAGVGLRLNIFLG